MKRARVFSGKSFFLSALFRVGKTPAAAKREKEKASGGGSFFRLDIFSSFPLKCAAHYYLRENSTLKVPRVWGGGTQRWSNL